MPVPAQEAHARDVRVLMMGELVHRMTVVEIINLVMSTNWRGELHLVGPAGARAHHRSGRAQARAHRLERERLGELLVRAGLLERAELAPLLRAKAGRAALRPAARRARRARRRTALQAAAAPGRDHLLRSPARRARHVLVRGPTRRRADAPAATVHLLDPGPADGGRAAHRRDGAVSRAHPAQPLLSRPRCQRAQGQGRRARCEHARAARSCATARAASTSCAGRAASASSRRSRPSTTCCAPARSSCVAAHARPAGRARLVRQFNDIDARHLHGGRHLRHAWRPRAAPSPTGSTAAPTERARQPARHRRHARRAARSSRGSRRAAATTP